MYPQNGTSSHACATPQGCAPNPAHGLAPRHASNPAQMPPPGYATPPISTPSPPVFSSVQVPPDHYPIELVQFWRNEHKPAPLHWALFVRTAPRPPSPCPRSTHGTHGPASAHARPCHSTTTATTTGTPPTPRGNYYELVGTPDTYTAQFLPSVTFEPETLPDWRGTHVIGWVNPGQLHVFERVVRQVPVWRHRVDWRSQQWVCEVVRAVGKSYQGVYVEGLTFGGLQRHMGKLLDAWENGDI